jgi:hypothetical protein
MKEYRDRRSSRRFRTHVHMAYTELDGALRCEGAIAARSSGSCVVRGYMRPVAELMIARKRNFNVFWDGDCMVIITTYHKSSNLTGRDKVIPRYLPAHGGSTIYLHGPHHGGDMSQEVPRDHLVPARRVGALVISRDTIQSPSQNTLKKSAIHPARPCFPWVVAVLVVPPNNKRCVRASSFALSHLQ